MTKQENSATRLQRMSLWAQPAPMPVPDSAPQLSKEEIDRILDQLPEPELPKGHEERLKRFRTPITPEVLNSPTQS
jgi:hypothetical protein